MSLWIYLSSSALPYLPKRYRYFCEFTVILKIISVLGWLEVNYLVNPNSKLWSFPRYLSWKEALLLKLEYGVNIRLIVDSEYMFVTGSKVPILAQAGVKVIHDHTTGLFHHKFAIVDHKILITGSLNWTRQEWWKSDDFPNNLIDWKKRNFRELIFIISGYYWKLWKCANNETRRDYKCLWERIFKNVGNYWKHYETKRGWDREEAWITGWTWRRLGMISSKTKWVI